MNFTLVRFLHGLLGTIIGAIIGLLVSIKIYDSPDIKTIIIVSVISFFVSFCWWENIIKFLYKTDINNPD
jgi:hypothetical protein